MNVNLSIPKVKFTRSVIAALAALVVMLAGGAWFYGQFHANPPKAWVLKWRISRYLKKEAAGRDFRVEFAFPSAAEMRTAPAKTKTGADAPGSDLPKKDFDTLKKEYIDLAITALRARRDADESQKTLERKRIDLAAMEKRVAEVDAASTNNNLKRLQSGVASVRTQVAALEKNLPEKERAAAAKEQAVEPLLKELWVFQREWISQNEAMETVNNSPLIVAQAALLRTQRQKFDEATSYGTMYRLIGQELWVADRLLDSANPDHRRVGMGLARQAGRDALDQTENGWLASSIYQAYVLPNLDLAANRATSDSLLAETADIFRRSDNLGGVVGMYETLLAQATTPQRADWARVQIGQSYEQTGDFKNALVWLKQVKATNDFRWAIQRIPWLERRAQRQR